MNKMKNKNRKEKANNPPREPWLSRFLTATGVDSFWNVEFVNKNLPFILFIVVLAWFHISNNHKSVNYIRSITKVEKEIKELRWQYMTQKSELMHDSKQSEVAAKVEELGLRELTNPPHIIEDR